MNMSAEAKLPKIAKNASATMNFIQAIISAPRQRSLLVVTMATVLGVALTVCLGVWQLSRGHEKEALHAAIMARQAQPALDTAAVLKDRSVFTQLHQGVRLDGRWLSQHTVYLENRPMQGRSGFIVLTPLQLDGGTTVLVQRGWIPRHQQDRTLLAPVDTPQGLVQVSGRIAAGPSEVMGLGETSSKTTAQTTGQSPIRQNLKLAEFSNEIGVSLVGTVLQTDADADGLQRNWPANHGWRRKALGLCPSVVCIGCCAVTAVFLVPMDKALSPCKIKKLPIHRTH
jgi:surfeit locus 1 family protein